MATAKQTGDDTRSSQQGRGQGSREMQRRDQGQRGMQRRTGSGLGAMTPFASGPFSLIRRMQEDFDRLLSNSLFGQGPGQRESRDIGLTSDISTIGEIMPRMETFQRGNEFVIRLDLPGVDAESIEVDVGEDAVIVRGDRRIEREDEREGVYLSEVGYGTFERVIPLPAGAVTDDATARLVNGVLEIVVPAPSQEAQRGRRLDVQRGAGERSGSERGSERTGSESSRQRS